LLPAGIQSILAASMGFLGLRQHQKAITDFSLILALSSLLAHSIITHLSKFLQLQASLSSF
jgi:multisubunit Na+/H+ antiporter MnhF subunit